MIFDKYAEFIDRGANLLIEIYDKLCQELMSRLVGHLLKEKDVSQSETNRK